jgi:hypothetical protein
MLHGPLLGYAHLKGHDIFEYYDSKSGERYLLPRYNKTADEADYDHMDHIEVALKGLHLMCRKFGVGLDDVPDVRKQTAIAPLGDFREANIHLIDSTFARLNLGGSTLPKGFERMYWKGEYIKQRRYSHVRSEERALTAESLFVDAEAPPESRVQSPESRAGSTERASGEYRKSEEERWSTARVTRREGVHKERRVHKQRAGSTDGV